MEQKLRMLLMLCMAVFFSAAAWAQERTITGRVTEASGEGAIGVNVVVKGTTTGTATDFDGNYSLTIGDDAKILVFSGIGYVSQDVEIGNKSTVDVEIAADVKQLDEVVVTALGISREKKALGIAVQEVDGSKLSTVKSANAVSNLSGQIAGVSIKNSPSMGGSSNVVIRGAISLQGDNQPLFVIDGVPISNSNFNNSEVARGGGGVDYGNAAQDINPDDIESVSVLKGASATALYGSRGANGVILITTKKGTKRKGIGVSINSNLTINKINEATMPKYQNQYGAGYGDYWHEEDLDGDGVAETKFVNFGDDASWGPAFDPSLNVVHWDGVSKTGEVLETRPWVASENGPEKFFKTGRVWTHNIALNGGNEDASFRLSFTNRDEKGTMPNSYLLRNNVSFNGSYNFTDKLTAAVSFNYYNQKGRGRQGTGYDWRNSRSFMASAAMWGQTNIDYERLKNYTYEDGSQRTWNRYSATNPTPAYWDNPYWMQYRNYNTDERNRVYGNVMLNYKATDWLTITARGGVDTYTDLREERIAKGSYAISDYTVERRNVSEENYDLYATFNKRFADDKISLTALVGTNLRKNRYSRFGASTVNGLVYDGIYSIENSVTPSVGISDEFTPKNVFGTFANFSVGYNDMIFLESAVRRDVSSAIPGESFTYPSVSTSFIFTELPALQNSSVLSFGKIRASYAEVGNDTDPYKTDLYLFNSPYNGQFTSYNPNELANNNLEPERQLSWEIGTELHFWNRRVSLDAAYYESDNINQIIAGRVSNFSGFRDAVVNAGKISNKGYELTLGVVPVKGDFTWRMDINYAKNVNEVVDLGPSEKFVLDSYYVEIAAVEGQPLGAILATNYVYDDNGNKIVGEDGFYKRTSEKEVVGSAAPDWTGGVRNTFSYKGFTLSALIDASIGGEMFSLTKYWGRGTGVLEETVFTNDLGNPVRNPVTDDATSGGWILDGVKEDGTPNTTRVHMGWNGGMHYNKLPEVSAVEDASWVKLRELSLSYNFPKQIIDKTPFTNISLAVVGSNLAILHRNAEHFDPEATYSTGGVQGLDIGTLPTSRSYGFNVKLGF
ncbi:SusC/RagA family TonB-linked outer membrane protein [Aureibacter tunicatorum]|uniref:TonB-linked SusC/RagA family outer membrane protein n=1 Tax=Aureibacter tunicatorum TaxID=866807 RepID=A0AAE3XJR0_9BACT|nr:SusC/RagA family TonB-linked outer membrane protein [Aureibacter tunicatorum]MDR6237667.1 TonB-linked SusC/RagA family outer membrane protein [Aureibacter tunicatorum]BDD02702.1 SusC/RagA family TonB-linked outer membrane protein [Aureibacter tunicatorum]